MSHRFRSPLREQEEPSINLTPLIDVVFVLLVIFVMVAPLIESDTVQLADGPEKRVNESAVTASGLAIQARLDRSIWFNGRQVELPELKTLLTQARLENPQRRPQLLQDKEAPFGLYQSIKNCAQEAGFSEMDVILKPS